MAAWTDPAGERLLTPDEVAELLGLHVRTVRRHVRDGRLRATRVGGRYRIAREAVEAFVDGPLESAVFDAAARPPDARVTMDVVVEPIGADAAGRLVTLLHASLVSDEASGLQLHTAVEPDRQRVRIEASGPAAPMAALLALVTAFREG